MVFMSGLGSLRQTRGKVPLSPTPAGRHHAAMKTVPILAPGRAPRLMRGRSFLFSCPGVQAPGLGRNSPCPEARQEMDIGKESLFFTPAGRYQATAEAFLTSPPPGSPPGHGPAAAPTAAPRPGSCPQPPSPPGGCRWCSAGYSGNCGR